MLGHFPLHPLGHPNGRPFGFAALLGLAGALANSALRTSDTASTYFPPVLRYSPVQTGIWGPCILVDFSGAACIALLVQ